MYWIYLIFFIFAVFAPDIIRRDFPFVPEERAEELLIFILGSSAFIMFLLKEKQLFARTREKISIQREASLVSKDLNDTYSHIGELNRKMDILKDIALGISEGPALTPEKKMEMYQSIIHAAQMFTKSNDVSLRFLEMKTGKTLKEIRKNKTARCDITNKIMIYEKKSLIETDEMFYVRSSKPINGIAACIAIEKKNKNQKIDDPELIKTLASQALFLFTL